MYKVKPACGVQNMYMKYTCHRQEFLPCRSDCLTFLFAVVFRRSSYLATTVRSAPVVSLYNVTLTTAHSRRLPKWIIFLKKPSNSDDTGPGERMSEGDRRLNV